MPRQKKFRTICSEPKNRMFLPEKENEQSIIVTLDEIEALRLCDAENFDQDDAAQIMDISRGTLQRILYSARKKVAQALHNGYAIKIDGGDYEISRHCRPCPKQCSSCRKDIKHEPK